MRDPFVFDSRSEFCKKPYGAVPCGSDVVFHVRPLTRAVSYTHLTLPTTPYV